MRARWWRFAAAAATLIALAGCTAVNNDGDASTAGGSPPAPSAPSQPSGQSEEPTPTPSPGVGPTCPTERCASVTVAGDLLIHTQLWAQARADAAVTGAGEAGMDFGPLMEGARPYVTNADLAVCHMETPVSTPEGPFSAYPSFNVPPQILTAAKGVGFDACDNASNHTIDQGTEGLMRTVDALDAAGLPHTGAYRSGAESRGVLIMDTPSAKIAIITGTYGLNGLVPEAPWQVDMLDAPTMIAKAQRAREMGADLVLANMHAGEEYVDYPNEQQTTTARALIDSGQFDAVYGEHTHSVLPIEKYNGKWIVYGMGNMLTELSPTYVVNNEGMIARFQFAQQPDGTWQTSDLAWAPSVIRDNPYRWCSVAQDMPNGHCGDPAMDAASYERTKATVNSMGAAEDGAREWMVTEDPVPGDPSAIPTQDPASVESGAGG